MSTELRPELSDFSSIVCLKSIITGMEEALGDKATAIALVAAGRARGKKLAETLGLTNQSLPLDEVSSKIAFAIGKDGTRLLILDKIEQAGEGYKAYTRETVCSAGEPSGSDRKCTFTLGAVQGVLEAVTGKRFRGQHTESVLRGGSHDVFEYAPLG
jgi:predicted hydrocarbon binding protein